MHNGTRRLHEIRVPTLVVSGDRDMTVPVRDQRALAEGISGSKHITLTGGGHALTIDRADEFNQLLLDFLGSSLAGTEAADTILPPGA
jgi:pimeloyl-ACP methyl ester carboxylesterase